MLRQEKVDFVRRAAADGMVLLKNDNNALPIKDKKIALFARLDLQNEAEYYSLRYGRNSAWTYI